ncbi:Cobyrinic acid a,c-diamide synthase [Methylophaga frappieri]|uniref:Cobyrinic acid a,c-diamide synthase n=1 Tax=Methylophaga frappieri (strain ATCC BAA-2434 / DSM 25690 / JAM7) TaxID=754477 RepID=I1YKP8_METFJ|nr:ParA family protein [Methylophaga frappieri]AFJ03491.1 Cobyrinic acid a,c-diamide synthase [Methylophaga frappieri]
MTNVSRVIAVMNQTHDVGKTFITANLADALHRQGKSVLVLDMDPQADLTRSFDVPSSQFGVSAWLRGERSFEQVSRSLRDGLTLIPADTALTQFDQQTETKRQFGNRLSTLLPHYAGQYDLVLLDCAAISGLLGSNAVLAASDMLLPVTGDATALQGMLDMLPVIRRVSLHRHKALRVWLCLNRLPRGSDYADKLTAMMRSYFPKRLLQTVIYEADTAQTTVYQSLAQDLLAGRTA